MNKIVKKIFALSSVLAVSLNVAACATIGGGEKYTGTLEPGFWASLVETTGGSTSNGGGLMGDVTGDAKINGDPTAATAYDGSEVTVTFYHTMGKTLRDVLDAWIPDFNAMYPNITIVHQQQGDYDGVKTQINTELNAQKAPSIAYCYPDHVAGYRARKAVTSLDDFIASTKTVTKADGTTEQMGLTQQQANDFVRGYYEEGRVYGDSKMYTLPYSKSTEVLYYNKTFFEANNLQVPTTWDEMETVLLKIAEIDPNCVPLGYDSEANWFITMCEQLGTPYTSAVEGQKFLFDNAYNHTFVDRLRKWYQLGLVTTEEIYGSYTSGLFTETEPGALRSYMCIGSSAGASYQCPDPTTDEATGLKSYPFEVGVALPPQIDPTNPKVISQGPSLCMFKKSAQEMAASWLFIKFLTTNLGLQANFSTASGYAPVIKDLDDKLPGYATDLESADGNEYLQTTCVKQCLNQENALFVSPAFVGSSDARKEVGTLIQKCFLNSPTDDQSAAEFIKSAFAATVKTLRSTNGN